jgi:hypothetical protein
MAIFKRKSVEVVPEISQYEFQPTTIRQVVVFSSWQEGPTFVHLEKQGENFVKGSIDGESWFTKKVETRQAGDELISSIRDDWKNAISGGVLPEGTSVYSWAVRGFGFAEVDFSVKPKNFPGDYVFSLGRELAEKIRGGWYPETDIEHYLVFNYFVLAPIRVGFFGPFKYILKTLTDRFPEICADKTPLFASSISASLGFGYGRIDAFATRGKRAPDVTYDWKMDSIHTLPELTGFKYPHLKTMQFLMRKSLRFLDYLESEQESVVITRFKSHALWSADMWHQVSGKPEESYLVYQQLICRIVYGKSGLAVRDRESRKIELASRKERHNLLLDKEFVQNLPEDEVAIYKRCIEAFEGNNSAIAHFALSMSQAFPIEFNWNEKTIALLFNSESEIARKAIWEAIDANPSLLRSIPPLSLLEFLDSTDTQRIEMFLTDFKSAYWAYGEVMNLWVMNHLNMKLSEKDLLIATTFLQAGWHSMSNDMYGSNPPNRDTLFLQVASQTKLEPFDAWAKCISIYLWNDDHFLGLFGIKVTDKYARGILDVIDVRNPEMLDFFAKVLANYVRYANNDRVINVLSGFEDSSKKGASELAWKVLSSQLIDQAKILLVLDHLNAKDPSGAPYLKGIGFAVQSGDREGVLQFLVSLSSESNETFWRRNKAEVEEILMKWKEFPLFFWENAQRIPARTSERIRKFEGLSNKILKLISPSAVARMNEEQIVQFLAMVKENPDIFTNVSLLRAMLIAPSAPINELAAKYVKDENKFSAHWLLMLESNLPVSQQSAFRYLETQVESKDFSAKLLMALDSNNVGARKLALSVLSSIKSPATLRKVVDGLVENRNTDTWGVVSKNLGLISDTDKYKEFTSHVFLSRRKGRKVKEEIKFDIEELIEDISEAIEKDTLIRMAHSSVARDRDWALKQIALSNVQIEGVTVENTWKGNLNV